MNVALKPLQESVIGVTIGIYVLSADAILCIHIRAHEPSEGSRPASHATVVAVALSFLSSGYIEATLAAVTS